MSKREVLLLLLVGVLLYFNWQNANNFKQLQHQISNVQGNMSHLQNQISNEVRGVAYTLEQQLINERWWSPVNFDVEGISGDKATVKLSWQVKEYEIGDKVGFNYRFGNSQEYTSAPVIEESPGFFVSRVEVNLPDEPFIEVRTSTHTRSGASTSKTVTREVAVEEKWIGDQANLNLQYYLVKETQGRLATSDNFSLDLMKLQFQRYNPVYGHVSVLQNRNGYSIDSYLNESINMSPVEGKTISASLVARDKSGQKVAGWEYKLEEGPDLKNFHLSANVNELPPSLYLVIKYSNGKTAERKLTGF